MKITPITSESNALLKKIRGLQLRHNREKLGLFLVEGSKLVSEAIAKGVDVREILVSKSFLASGLAELNSGELSGVSVVDDKVFKEVVTTEASCGIVAVAATPRFALEQLFERSTPLVLIAEAIQDPGNLGTIIRTALAARATGMMLTKGTVDPFNPKVVRGAAGALFVLPIVTELSAGEAFACCKERGLNIVATQPTASKLYWQVDFTRPTALVFSNEGQGASSPVLAQADETVAIPMSEESESLNVSISAGIILFSAVQQRLAAAGRC
jgi:TrmH family RNA methyltransferase